MTPSSSFGTFGNVLDSWWMLPRSSPLSLKKRYDDIWRRVMIQQGKFNKRTFKGYAKQACDRRLYLHGNGREGWTYSDGSPVALDEQTHGQAINGCCIRQDFWRTVPSCTVHTSRIMALTVPSYIDEDVWLRQKTPAKGSGRLGRIQDAVAQNGFVFAFELMWKPEEDFIIYMGRWFWTAGNPLVETDPMCFLKSILNWWACLMNNHDFGRACASWIDCDDPWHQKYPIGKVWCHFSDVIYYILCCIV